MGHHVIDNPTRRNSWFHLRQQRCQMRRYKMGNFDEHPNFRGGKYFVRLLEVITSLRIAYRWTVHFGRRNWVNGRYGASVYNGNITRNDKRRGRYHTKRYVQTGIRLRFESRLS